MADPTTSRASESAWSPLRGREFRALWLAALASNVGLWVQNAAGSWDMTSFGTAPVYVALLQTASSLPVFLVGLPAAAFGDVFDRRKLLMTFATWMALVSAALAALSFTHRLTPTNLLALTFSLGLGAAFSAPLWQTILPSLVQKNELASAVTLSGVAINIARAVGPAIGGIGIALAGSGPVYSLNAVAFLFVIFQAARWKQETKVSPLPPERVASAVVAGLRFARRAPALRAVLVRAASFILFASALWALLPVVARRELHMTPLRFGLLLGFIGLGALSAATVMPVLRQKLGVDKFVTLASLLYAGSMLVLAFVRLEFVLYIAMLTTGFAWMSVMSSFNVAAASSAPGWVQSRALGLYLLVFQGGLALGSFGWGTLAGQIGSEKTLFLATAGAALGMLSGLRWKLASAKKEDVVTFEGYPEPIVDLAVELDAGPILVEHRFLVTDSQRAEFMRLMANIETLRRRDGAFEWALYEDIGQKGTFVETFLVASWAEHLRQHRRIVAADKPLLDRLREVSEDRGVVHLVEAKSAAKVLLPNSDIAHDAHDHA